MNTPVNVELAKMLIRKGIDHKNFYYWNMVNYSGEWKLDTRIWESCCDYYEAPTIADVVMWLYEKHGIWMWVEKYENESQFVPQIPKANLQKVLGFFNSPTEAYSAAIEYTLKNLI